MKREANIYLNGILTGVLSEDGLSFHFQYDRAYLSRTDAKPISLTFPLKQEAFTTVGVPPFFCGLLAEGVNKELQCRLLKIDQNDLFGQLLKTANKDTIGAVTVIQKTSKS